MTGRAPPWLYANEMLGRLDEAMRTMETGKQKWCEAEVNRVAGEIAFLSPEAEKAKAEEYFDPGA
jgi:hypothetical protein